MQSAERNASWGSTTRRPERAFRESIPHIVWTASADGKVDYANSRWFTFSGETERDRLYPGWLQAIHPDDRPATLKRWRQAVESGVDYEVEFRLRRADGVFHWMLARAVAKRDRRGRIVKWFGTMTDIDAQRRRERSLQYIDEAGAALTDTRDVPSAIRETARFIVRRLADWCAIYVLVRNGELEPRAVEHADPAKVARAREFVHDYGLRLNDALLATFSQGKALLVPAISVDALRRTELDDPQHFGTLVRELSIGTMMCVPVMLNERLWGVLQLAPPTACPELTSDDLHIGEQISKRLQAALENALLFEQHRREAKSLRFIATAGERLSTSLNLQTTLEALLSLVVPGLADVAIVNLIDPRSEQLIVRAIEASDPQTSALLQSLVGDCVLRDAPLGRRLLRRLKHPAHIIERQAQNTLAMFVDPRFHPFISMLRPTSAIVAPLLSQAGFLGSVALISPQPEQTYTVQDIPVVEELARRAAIAIENAHQYAREELIAKSFQAASLPMRLPTVPGLEFDAWYQPAARAPRVGGDWYDAVKLPDGRVVVSIGDIVGSGVDAAVTMSTIRHIIRGVAYVNPDPIRMLDAADKTMRAEYPDTFATAAVAVLDPVTMLVACASAGHLAPLVLTADDNIVPLATPGLPLGLRGRDEPPVTHTSIIRNALLVFYTDGLIESTHDILDGERRLRNALTCRKLRGPGTAKAIVDAVIVGSARDDVALLTIATSALAADAGLSRWTFDIRDAAASRDVRMAILRLLLTPTGARVACGDAEIVLGELLGNVLRYAPGEVEVVLDASNVRPVLHVLDRGPGFRHNGLLPADMLSETGRGLFLAATLSDELHVTRRPDGGSHARAVLAEDMPSVALRAPAFDAFFGA